jgi:hypothetical protein
MILISKYQFVCSMDVFYPFCVLRLKNYAALVLHGIILFDLSRLSRGKVLLV